MKLYERVLGSQARPAAEAPAEEVRTGEGLTLDQLLPLMSSPDALWTSYGSRGDTEVIQHAYDVGRRNGPVFALTAARLQVFSQARFQWSRGLGGNPRDMFGTPALSLIEKPWRGARTPDLLARMELGASGAGNAFIRRIRRGVGPAREDRLFVLRPDWVTIILGSQENVENPADAADCEVVGYMYTPGGQSSKNSNDQFFTPDEIGHYAPIPDPSALYRGMSWVTPVLHEVAGDQAMDDHKLAFFQNAATPNLAIKFDPSIALETAKKFKAMIEEGHVGAANAYKTLFLGGGADPVSIGTNLQQIDFTSVQGKGESRLASAAGVPASWAGFSEGLQGSALNAGNFDAAARRRLGDGTMQHLWACAAAALEGLFVEGEKPDGNVMLWHDTRWVPFLRDDAASAAETQQKQASTINSLIMQGFTPESAIEAVIDGDLSLLEHTGRVSVQLYDSDADPAAPATEDPATDPEGDPDA